MRRVVVRVAQVGIVVFLLIQLVPYGWTKDNPPVIQDAPWPDAESAQLARDACYDCHSNETVWPVYSYVAPMSWLVRRDVEAGRDELNFSDWAEDGDEAGDAIETLLEGEMPPREFELLHPAARLSDAEVDQLVTALESMGAVADEDDDDD
jgi:hypothetical protein